MAHAVNPQHDGKSGQFANYAPLRSQFLPYLFNATMTPYGTSAGAATVEVTPTSHGGILRFSFPPPDTDAKLTGSYNATRRVLVSLLNTKGNAVNISGTGASSSPLAFAGVSTDNLPMQGALHFVATLQAQSGAALAPLASGAGSDGGNVWAWYDFDSADAAADVLVVRIATSLISPEQAQAAFAAEVGGASFEDALTAAKAEWHALATRVTVGDVGAGRTDAEAADLLSILYSCLYRASKFPRALWEVDYQSGNAIHWSPYKGGVMSGPLSSDVGVSEEEARRASAGPHAPRARTRAPCAAAPLILFAPPPPAPAPRSLASSGTRFARHSRCSLLSGRIILPRKWRAFSIRTEKMGSCRSGRIPRVVEWPERCPT